MVIAITQNNSIVQLINNAVHDIGTRSAYSMIVQYGTPFNTVPITLTMINNIFSNSNGEIWMASSVTPQFQNNLLNRDSSAYQISIDGAPMTISQLNSIANCSGNITENPQFINPVWGGSNGDYHLQAGSLAIDSGTSSGAPSTDLDGNSRPQGGGYDLGVYEQ